MFKISMDDFNIEKIADSGQCFRINRIKTDRIEEQWRVIACNKTTIISKNPFNQELTIECPFQDNMFWMYYFDLNTNYLRFRNSVDQEDIFLRAAVDYGVGIRILRQNPWEMLITFIISQRRSIPSIKTCVERLCTKYGDEIEPGVFAFPTALQLSNATMDELLECGLGYRAEYVYLASKQVASGELDLLSYDYLSDEDLLTALQKIRGVGPKVANCVSLFGYYRIAAFPVDVWIDRVQQRFYQGKFPTWLYEGYAGVMQQYIFYYIRNLDKI